MGAVHALAYPIGGIFHVPHGLSNSLVLPHVLRFNAAAAAPLYVELADVLMPGNQGDDTSKTAALINFMEQIAIDTGSSVSYVKWVSRRATCAAWLKKL